MRNIIIVECISTGLNFIEDIINRGYNPIVLELKIEDSEEGKKYLEMVHKNYDEIDYDFEIIYEKDEYDETLEMVKKLDPLLVLPGNEKGVILATKLSYDLGLLANSIENIDAMTLKNEMHNRLAENGLRSIRGKVIYNIAEAVEFYDSKNLKEVVIKPTYGAGSTSVKICENRDEMIDAVEDLFTKSNFFGNANTELLIQERIKGEEYIVNTVSCKGHHRVTLVWKYNKVKMDDGSIVYDGSTTIDELNVGEAEMVEYAYKVADAIGIEYGPVHGEYMIDENGPVLIEVNCRPCGAHMEAEYLDRISGQHETDSILDAYLKPKRFAELAKKPYRLFAHGSIKLFIVPRNIIARSTPIAEITGNLKSHYKTAVSEIYDHQLFIKTQDIQSNGGTIYLVNEDRLTLKKELNLLRTIEKHAFSLILNEELPDESYENDTSYPDEIKQIFETGEQYGSGLFVTDQIVDNLDILQVKISEVGNINGKFDYVVVNLNKSIAKLNNRVVIKVLLDIISKVKTNGLLFVPKNTFQKVPEGRKGVESIVKSLGLRIELPPYGVSDMIVASRS